MDKPDHITVAVIGDGESETGPTAAAWHAHKVNSAQPQISVLLMFPVLGSCREWCCHPDSAREWLQGKYAYSKSKCTKHVPIDR